MAKKQYYEYKSDAIRVRYEPRRCIHAAECVKGAPDVFDRHSRPWIQPESGAADAVADVVMQCPTGALHFERLDEGASGSASRDARARVIPDGPIYIQGRLMLDRPDGSRLPENRLALCRCGASENKPFCDGSHERVGFSDRGGLGNVSMAPVADETDGELVLTPMKDGPVLFQGALAITGSTGDGPQSHSKGALCRCGASQNKPYCDGSHRTAGFEAD